MNREKIKRIAGVAILVAIEVVLTIISNYVPIGNTNINLGLVPIVMGAYLYGPLEAMFIGFINGFITIIAPATQASFFALSPVGTILVCLLKTGLAGLIAGFVFKEFKKHETLGVIIISILVPLINSVVFVCGCLIFFRVIYMVYIETDESLLFVIIASMISINMAIEFGSCLILCPSLYRALKKLTK